VKPHPTFVSFSGGRSSGYMLYRLLQKYDGELPHDWSVIFCNTGREMPQTLDFVRDCQEHWGVPVVWLERYCKKNPKTGKNTYETCEVSYETAARDGEPFELLVNQRNMLPNPRARFCTGELKVKAILDYRRNTYGRGVHNDSCIGIRYDEPKRYSSMSAQERDNQSYVFPLYDDRITLHDVDDFWNNNDFDLRIPSSWGNCDLCFLKHIQKRASITRERPDLVDWWIDREKSVTIKGDGSRFRINEPSYEKLKVIATSGFDFGPQDDAETLGCFCGD